MRRQGLFVAFLSVLAIPWIAWADVSWRTVPQGGTPLIITSAGQSSGVKVARVLTIRSGLERKMVYVPTLKASKLNQGKAATLMVFVGLSKSDLASEGLTVDSEIQRISAVLNKAASQGMTIVVAHIDGGMGRGASGSDAEKIIDVVLPFASYLVVSREGDEDQRFANWATSRKIPLAWLDDPLELASYIRAMYSRQ